MVVAIQGVKQFLAITHAFLTEFIEVLNYQQS